MRALAVLALSASLTLAACGRGGQHARSTSEASDELPTVGVSPADEEMNAAIREAQRTIEEFERRIAAPTPTQSYASLKVKFEEAGKVEHIWLDKVRFADGVFEGEIGNAPESIQRLKLGDKVKARLEDISDWMVVDGKQLIGGYSVRLLRKRMSEQERAEFDSGMPFVIED
jgi:uncharacterized protein YegJ (DUF2314 family)